jgi:hypothetical protein
MIKYQQHIDNLVLWYINGILSNILFSLNNMLPPIIGNLVNNLLMPIVRKTRLSDNMRTNLRGKICWGS